MSSVPPRSARVVDRLSIPVVGDKVTSRCTAAAAAVRHGQFEAAAQHYRQALELAPHDPNVWAGIAEFNFVTRRPDEALAAWDRVLALRPGAAVVLCGKARVEQSLGRVAAAEQLLRRALVREPDFRPGRHAMALLLLEAGRLAEAVPLVARLQADAPGNPDVIQLAARLAMASGELEPARTALTQLIVIPELPPLQRAAALLQLGNVLGDLGLAPEAFAAAVAGKAIEHDVYAERAGGREGEAAKLQRLAAWFSRMTPGAWQPVPRLAARFAGEAATHIFLVGFPRSGTTLLEQVLAGHSQVLALEEAPTLADHYAEFLADDAGCVRLAALSAPDADIWRARYWATVAAHGIDASGRVFVDKAPAGTLSLPLIVKLFPGAKVLFALRDPRDVVLSCLRNAFQMNATTYAFTTLTGTAACYDAGMTMAQQYRAVLPLDLTEVRHETLVDGFDTELARVAAFIGIEVEPAMRDVAATARARPVRTPSAAQVRAGLNRRGLARWREYAAELAPVLPILQPWVERFGYAT